MVELAAEKAEWGRKLPARHGLGIAAHRSFVTYVATVVEAAVDEKGTLSVPRVDVAIDCGFHVNPERIRSQIEGACVMGMALATKSAITFKGGRVVQSNFTDYEVPRIDDAPREMRVHIVPAGLDVPPGGVGEPGAAALRAGAVQRDLRRDRQAHPRAADRLTTGDMTSGGGRHAAPSLVLRSATFLNNF